MCFGFLVSGFVLQSLTPVAHMCGALEYLGEVFGSFSATPQCHCFGCLWDVRNEKAGGNLHVLVVIKTSFQVVI